MHNDPTKKQCKVPIDGPLREILLDKIETLVNLAHNRQNADKSTKGWYKAMTKTANGKMVAFVLAAIKELRKDNKPNKNTGIVSKGIHSVYSGFNEVFRDEFNLDKDDAIDAIDGLLKTGAIEGHYAKGGMMLFLPGEMGASGGRNTKKLCDRIHAAMK